MNDLQNALEQLKRRAAGQREAMLPKEAQALLDERNALQEALEPLNWDDSEIASHDWCPDDKVIGEVSAGDIRRARAALNKTRNEEA